MSDQTPLASAVEDDAAANTDSSLQQRPEDPADPALDRETLGIDDTDTALATEDASNPAE